MLQWRSLRHSGRACRLRGNYDGWPRGMTTSRPASVAMPPEPEPGVPDLTPFEALLS